MDCNDPKVRHLHWRAEDRRTLCRRARWVPVRAGSKVYHEPGYPSVHVSKARKSDCEECRAQLRAVIRQEREYHEARRVEEASDRELVVNEDGTLGRD